MRNPWQRKLNVRTPPSRVELTSNRSGVQVSLPCGQFRTHASATGASRDSKSAGVVCIRDITSVLFFPSPIFCSIGAASVAAVTARRCLDSEDTDVILTKRFDAFDDAT